MDSLLDLNPSNTTILDIPPNWEASPAIKREVMINTNMYPGTIQSIEFFRLPVNTMNYRITDLTSKLYPLLIFFADCVGRQKNFWLPDVAHRFVPTAIENTGFDLIIEKLPDLYLAGHERIYIQTSDGSRYTRKVMSITQQTSTTKLVLASQLTGLDVQDIIFCGFIFYVRFDMDVLDIEYHTDNIASAEVSFVELLKEYDNWGGA